MEVQAILDKNRCPIVQIIDDDKGEFDQMYCGQRCPHCGKNVCQHDTTYVRPILLAKVKFFPIKIAANIVGCLKRRCPFGRGCKPL